MQTLLTKRPEPTPAAPWALPAQKTHLASRARTETAGALEESPQGKREGCPGWHRGPRVGPWEPLKLWRL